jgi:hypothetical protein
LKVMLFETAVQVWLAPRVTALLRVWPFVLSLEIPAPTVRGLPPRTNAPAPLPNVSERMLQAVSTLGDSWFVPASTIAAVPLLVGAMPPAQFERVLQLLSLPPPFQMNVAAEDGQQKNATAQTISLTKPVKLAKVLIFMTKSKTLQIYKADLSPELQLNTKENSQSSVGIAVNGSSDLNAKAA